MKLRQSFSGPFGIDRPQMLRACGFTLIEVLVVVAIIGILAAILLPALSHARAAGKRTVCQGNLHNIGLATIEYAHNNRGWFPLPVVTGGWSYRVAPGRVFPEDAPGLDPQPKPEVFGLPTLYARLRMLPERSEVWVCPAAVEWMQVLGNTYSWQAQDWSHLNDKTKAAELMRMRYRQPEKWKKFDSRNTFVQDNTDAYPAISGYPVTITQATLRAARSQADLKEKYKTVQDWIPNADRKALWPHKPQINEQSDYDRAVNGWFYDGHVGLKSSKQ